MATFTRKNVYSKGGDFSDPTLLWYARGVKAMNARALADPLGFRFFAGIHGYDRNLWRALGYLKTGEKLPTPTAQRRFWKQCQHGTWYFLPWHRGYLLALEACIRAEVVKLKGPKDWALPYWNVFGPDDQNQLPPAFASPNWPDGKGNNPLFIKARYGPNDDGDVYVDLSHVNLNAMTVPEFTGTSNAERGFGGLDTGFEHGGSTPGRLEQQPHNQVHVEIGGGNPDTNLPGLMSDPDTAGLDPIFYLHHCNIDRLWEVWLQSSVSEGNPTDKTWLAGPASIGERAFVMPLPPNGDPWNYTPGEMADLSKLDYTYDDVSSAAEAKPVVAAMAEAAPAARLRRLGAKKARGAAVSTKKKKKAELVGANKKALRLSGTAPVQASVQLQPKARKKVSASLVAAAAAMEAAPPDRVYLNLENVRGLNDATTFQVFVNGRLADTVSLFGARKATVAGGEHGGQGLNLNVDITQIVDELHLQDELEADKLDVQLVPLKHVSEEAQVSIGRISIFRQGQ